MSKLTDALPEVVAIDEQIARTREQEKHVMDKGAKGAVKHRDSVAKWRAQADEDVRAGRDPKPAPPPPDESVQNAVLATFRGEIEAALRERRRAIVRASGTIRSQVEKESREILRLAAAPVSEIRQHVASMRSIVAALDDVADCRQSLDPYQSTSQRRPPAVDVQALLWAIDHGLDELLRGREDLRPHTLGLQPGHTLHVPPVETSEPAPTPAAQSTRPSTPNPVSGRTVRVFGFNGKPM